MRTTLTIDPDIAARLARLRKEQETSLKALINEALRRGLSEMAMPPKKQKPFRTRSMDVGGVLVKNIDNISELLDEIEGEWHR